MKKLILILFAFFILSTQGWAATNDFIATGGGLTDSTAYWSLGHFPDATEDCTFSGIDGLSSVSINGSHLFCKTIDYSTTQAPFDLSGGYRSKASGDITLKVGMTLSGAISFLAPGTLYTNNVLVPSITIDTNATMTLGDSLSGNILLMNSGAVLTTNNYSISGLDLRDGTGNITLTLGSSLIGATVITLDESTLTVTANTATITLTSTANASPHFGGVDWNGASLVTVTTASKTLTINGANTFAAMNLTWTGANAGNAFIQGANQTVTGAITSTNMTTLNGAGYSLIKTSGTVSLSGVNIVNSVASGGATFKCLLANGCTDGGGNTGWIFDDRVAPWRH